jgi:hypothetical protein
MTAATVEPTTTNGLAGGRTVHGIDRATIRPTVWILAVVAVFVLGVPLVNTLVQRSSPIPVGTVYPVGMDVTFTPDSTWSYADRYQAANNQGVAGGGSVTRGGVTFDVATGSWGATLTELNTTVNRQLTATDDLSGPASSTSVSSTQGVAGVLTTYQGATTSARVYTFLDQGTAVQIVARGPVGAMAHELPGVERMVDSVTFPKEPSLTARQTIATEEKVTTFRARFERATDGHAAREADRVAEANRTGASRADDDTSSTDEGAGK